MSEARRSYRVPAEGKRRQRRKGCRDAGRKRIREETLKNPFPGKGKEVGDEEKGVS